MRGDSWAGAGCGKTALSLLTGEVPTEIKIDSENGVEDEEMIKHLLKFKYRIAGLTLENINPKHVILMSNLHSKEGTSWFVHYKEMVYHNFESWKLGGLEFINRPIRSAYLLKHPTWANNLV